MKTSQDSLFIKVAVLRTCNFIKKNSDTVALSLFWLVVLYVNINKYIYNIFKALIFENVDLWTPTINKYYMHIYRSFPVNFAKFLRATILRLVSNTMPTLVGQIIWWKFFYCFLTLNARHVVRKGMLAKSFFQWHLIIFIHLVGLYTSSIFNSISGRISKGLTLEGEGEVRSSLGSTHSKSNIK